MPDIIKDNYAYSIQIKGSGTRTQLVAALLKIIGAIVSKKNIDGDTLEDSILCTEIIKA